MFGKCSPFRLVGTSFITVLFVLVLAGCSKSGPQFVDEGTAYTEKNLTQVLEQSDSGELRAASGADAEMLRQEALTGLRRQGGPAADAAALITDTFPANATGVPYYVERATFDGKPCLVIIEARGPKAATLSNRLLWVIGENREVLFSVMR